MSRPLWIIVALAIQIDATSIVFAQSPPKTPQEARQKLRNAFEKLDADSDGTLSEKEYIGEQMDDQRRRRDYRLFDFDQSESLTFEEFTAIPGLVPPHFRGPIPDPFDFLLEQSRDAMDAAYVNWDENPNIQIAAQTFVINFMASLSPDGVRRFDSDLQTLADQDGNRQISRVEALRFLKVQLGIIGPDGTQIREPNGRVLFYTRHRYLDMNKDGKVTRQEFIDRDWRDNAGEFFDSGDTDGDGILTLQEYASPEWTAHEDALAKFLTHDKDFNGKLSVEELNAFSPEKRRQHVPYAIPQFDDNGDGELSLDEFLFTMFANRLCWWEKDLIDKDRSGKLSFDEFTFDSPPIALLRRLYFHRFDQDGDGELSPEEYAFTRKPSDEFHLIALDGSGFKKLHSSEEYVSIGSPDPTRDGTRIAFDGRKGGESLSKQQIMVLNTESGKVDAVLEGMMPVWSPDGKKFCCSRNRPDSGIWMANADGSDPEKISEGWGAQWSPDGNWIAYTDNGGVSLYEVATRKSREVLSQEDNPYRYIYYNAAWSPDSHRLCFKGTKDKGADIASIRVTGDDPDLQVHFSSELSFDNDIVYAADGKSVFFSLLDAKLGKRQVHRLSVSEKSEPEIIEGGNPDASYSNVTLSHDGKSVIATAHY